MPASIVLSGLSWTTPNGEKLLSNLDLTLRAERTGLVGRNGAGKSTLLALITGALTPASGSVSADGTLGMLRQDLARKPGETIAGLFGVAGDLAILRRAERGEAGVEELASADWTLEARMEAALSRLGLSVGPETLLEALSGGQVTRAALAALIFGEPDFLLLDEPTNNLDGEGREAVADLLQGWRAGAIVVSHDRQLLERMDATVELTSLGARRYGGNWSAYREIKAQELAAAEQDLADAEKQVVETARAVQLRAERKARTDRAGRRKAARGDMPRIVAGARKNTASATSGANARLAEKREMQARDAVEEARGRIEAARKLTVSLPSTMLPEGRTVLMVERLGFGYAPDRALIRDLSFAITGPERVVIGGPNGSGKTSLLRLITGRLKPDAGGVRLAASFAMLDQKVSLLNPSASIRDNFRRINPEAGENACRAALARFGFRADAAMQRVSTLSGGERLRAGLACVLGGPTPPELLILDEPTNHLDIASIEAVEAGLNAHDGALLLVSHDEAFLSAVGVTRRIDLQAWEAEA